MTRALGNNAFVLMPDGLTCPFFQTLLPLMLPSSCPIFSFPVFHHLYISIFLFFRFHSQLVSCDLFCPFAQTAPSISRYESLFMLLLQHVKEIQMSIPE